MTFSKRKFQLFLAVLAVFLTIVACGVFGAPTPTAAPTRLPESTAPAAEPTAPAAVPEDAGAPTETIPTDAPEPGAGPTPAADLDSIFAPFWQTWGLLHRYFVDQPIDDPGLVQGAIDAIIAFTEMTDSPVSDETISNFSAAANTPDELKDLFAPFWRAWIQAIPDQDVQMMRAALAGMVDSLGDQHTSYMDPDQFIQANIPIDGSYEGIGAWVDPNTEYLTIVSPMPGSPAEEAGLKPGDQIIQVDGDDMTGIDGNLVIRRVLGPAGSEVTLTVRREGVEDFDVVVIRARISIPGVTGEILEESNVAYVQLFTFGDTTGDELHDILVELLAQNPVGLIFDLRNNGGGLLSTAIEVASEFIPDGIIMYEEYGDGSNDVYRAIQGGAATRIPMVVLVNEGSASASEIVAGAIQDFGRALLVGTTSFGKGSVQNWLPLVDDGAVRITIARWYTPDKRLIHEVGLTPDVMVEFTEEDFAAGLDPQLEKAIELLTQD